LGLIINNLTLPLSRGDRFVEMEFCEEEKSKRFICSACKFSGVYHYYGTKPPFAKNIM
jgi:hypothetical protein